MRCDRKRGTAVENGQEVGHVETVSAKGSGVQPQKADRKSAMLRRLMTQEKGQTESYSRPKQKVT